MKNKQSNLVRGKGLKVSYIRFNGKKIKVVKQALQGKIVI